VPRSGEKGNPHGFFNSMRNLEENPRMTERFQGKSLPAMWKRKCWVLPMASPLAFEENRRRTDSKGEK